MSTTAVPVVRVDDVSKRFIIKKDKSIKERLVNFKRADAFKEDFWALNNITMDIEAGSTIGLIGPNGSGKSTLLKVIGGIIQPSTGSVTRRGRLAALLELGAGFHPDLTGRENVYLNASILGMSQKETALCFDDIVEFSGIEQFIDTQVKFYSSGMYVRLAFAVAVHVDPDVLLVDEVLAVGDEAFQKKCLDKIASFQEEGRTIILVTHTLNQVTDLCTRGVVLARGSVVFDGDPHDAVSVLRSGFKTLEDDAANAAVNVRSLELGRILAVRTSDGVGNATSTFEAGDDLVVEVDIDAPKPLPEWAVGVHIDNPLGQVVTGATSETLGMQPRALNGPATVKFTLPKLAFGAGDYGITVALTGTGHKEIARSPRAALFSVREPYPRTWGPLRSDMSVAFTER